MKRDIVSVSVETLDPTIIRNQKLTACEMAYVALMNADEPPLRWFTISMLRLPATWMYIVGMALWKPDTKGALAWRAATNPFAMLRVIARRTALRWQPELVFGCNADKVLHPCERAISTLKLRVPEDGEMQEDVLGYWNWHSGAATRRNGHPWRQYPDWEPEDDLKFYITEELCFNPPRDGLHYDWDTIGARAGFNTEETALLKGRFKGYTRTGIGRFLGWDEHRVQAVWRRVNRRLDDDNMLHRLELVLIGDIKEPPLMLTA